MQHFLKKFSGKVKLKAKNEISPKNQFIILSVPAHITIRNWFIMISLLQELVLLGHCPLLAPHLEPPMALPWTLTTRRLHKCIVGLVRSQNVVFRCYWPKRRLSANRNICLNKVTEVSTACMKQSCPSHTCLWTRPASWLKNKRYKTFPLLTWDTESHYAKEESHPLFFN